MFKTRTTSYKEIQDFNEFASKAQIRPRCDIYKKNPKNYYSFTEIDFFQNSFIDCKKDFGWGDERIIGVVAHTIGHEIFIHFYRKGILEAWENRDFDKVKILWGRDKGGDEDHLAYLKKVNDKGIILMRQYQKELSSIIGVQLFNKKNP